jgi:hypothetical protein
VWELQIKDKRDPPLYGSIKQASLDFLGENWGTKDLREWLQSLSRFVPTLIIAEENYVHLEQKPDYIIQQIIGIINDLPDPTIGGEVIKAIS